MFASFYCYAFTSRDRGGEPKKNGCSPESPLTTHLNLYVADEMTTSPDKDDTRINLGDQSVLYAGHSSSNVQFGYGPPGAGNPCVGHIRMFSEAPIARDGMWRLGMGLSARCRLISIRSCTRGFQAATTAKSQSHRSERQEAGAVAVHRACAPVLGGEPLAPWRSLCTSRLCGG